MFKTPVLFLIFNRPEQTRRVFEEIRKARPEKLFIAADGPRAGEEETEKCEQTRKVVEIIDWQCEVKTLFRDKNLGCKIAVSSAINWFFDQVEEGIILEDDCLPNQSFFAFCEALLEKYRSEETIMHIGGVNFQKDMSKKYSYYFSKYPHIWGWATWKRAWKKYDISMNHLEEFLKSGEMEKKCPVVEERLYWQEKFIESKEGKINTWDYQWMFTCWLHHAYSISPTVNMVKNIGFGDEATHTHSMSFEIDNMSLTEMKHIVHPNEIKHAENADLYIFKNILMSPEPEPPLIERVKAHLSSQISSPLKGFIKKNILKKSIEN